MTTPEPLPLETDVKSLSDLQSQQADFVLIDVREQDEYETAKIEGAILIPMSQLRDRISELERYRDRHMIVHCHHGGRSLQVTEFLRQLGFDQAQNLAGGIDAWSLEIDHHVPRY